MFTDEIKNLKNPFDYNEYRSRKNRSFRPVVVAELARQTGKSANQGWQLQPYLYEPVKNVGVQFIEPDKSGLINQAPTKK